MTKTIIWFELSVPLEENILDAHLRKLKRYSRLKTRLTLNGWTVYDHTVEIGCLGFVNSSASKMFKCLGASNKQKNFAVKRLATTARRSSFILWQNRRAMHWNLQPLHSRKFGGIFPSLSSAEESLPTNVTHITATDILEMDVRKSRTIPKYFYGLELHT